VGGVGGGGGGVGGGGGAGAVGAEVGAGEDVAVEKDGIGGLGLRGEGQGGG
jgi:hypothetical protein